MISHGNRVLIGLQVLLGVALFVQGSLLIYWGGSPYYVLAGATLCTVAWLGVRRSRAALWVYGSLFLGTVIWAVWEAGSDGWALASRLGVLTVIGLWMLTPGYREQVRLPRRFAGDRWFWGGSAALLIAAIALVFLRDSAANPDRGDIDRTPPDSVRAGEWQHWGNTAAGTRFSPLQQITTDNVGLLQPVWTYRSGESEYAPESMFAGTLTFEATPLKIGDALYFCTGYNDVIALDAETGSEIWRHQPQIDAHNVVAKTCRGVAHYRIPGASGHCAGRIYTATLDARLIALDTATGRPCENFGDNGEVDLLQGLGPVIKGYYLNTSPPTVVRGRLVLGGWVMDGQMVGEPAGVIRAFDAATGQFSWAFDIGRPGQHGMPPEGESFTRGTPNSWSVMSADEQLGLVYVPTGNATPDYFGGHRSRLDEKYASSIVALNADTGAPVWSFQTTHHDLWDYDVPAQPVLIDLADGKKGLLQATKRGEVFFLDRITGEPLADVDELPVPQGAAPGDWTAPTQPFSTGLPSFEGPMPSERDMWGVTPIDHAWCRLKFRQARFEGTMTPVGLDRPTLTWPGYLGGINWGSVSVNPKSQIMIVNSTHVAVTNQLISRSEANARGITPVSDEGGKRVGLYAPQSGTPYAALTSPFLSFLGVPCQEPPYGLISAVDLQRRELLWQKPLGTARDSGPLLLRSLLPIPIGVPNLGGSMNTAADLTFIAATQERVLRAYRTSTGEELWKARLPAGGHATPATYWSDSSNRQFVVVAAGGHGAMLSGSSDALVAFALPEAH